MKNLNLKLHDHDFPLISMICVHPHCTFCLDVNIATLVVDLRFSN